MAEYNLGRAEGEIVIHSDKAEAAFRRAGKAQDEFGDGSRRAAKAHKEHNDSALRLVDTAIILKTSLALVKFPAMVSGAMAAAQALNAFTAAAVAMLGALGPATGVVAALPGLFSAAGQGIGTFKLATGGVGDALKHLASEADTAGGKALNAFEKLSPAAQKFTKTLFDLRPVLESIRSSAQEKMFPGFEAGIKSVMPLIPAFRSAADQTAFAIGNLGKRAGELVGSGPFAADFRTLAGQNVETINRFGTVLLHVADSLRHVMIGAMPLVDWLTHLAVVFTRNVTEALALNRANGSMAEFFQRTINVLSTFGNIIANVGKALFNTFKLGTDLGNDLLTSLEKLTRKWSDWTSSVEGENQIRSWFENARPSLEAVGRLIQAVIDEFGKIGKVVDFPKVLDQISTQLVPALGKLSETASQTFTTSLINTVTKLVDAFTKLSRESGPLTVFVNTIGLVASALSKFLSIPGVSAAVSALAVSFATLNALKLSGAVTGITALTNAIRILRGTVAAGDVSAKAGLLAAGMARLGNFFKFAATNARLLWAALIANPFVLVGAAVIALVVLIVKNWDTVKAWTISTFNSITAFFRQWGPLILGILTGGLSLLVMSVIRNWDAIKANTRAAWDTFTAILRAIWPVLLAIFTGGLSLLVMAVVRNWDSIKTRTTETWNNVRAKTSEVWNSMTSTISGIVNRIREVISNTIQAARDRAIAVWNNMRDATVSVLSSLRDRAASIINSVGSTITGVFGRIASSASAAVNGVISAFERLWARIKSIAAGIKNAISGIPFMKGSPIPMVVDAKAMAKGVNDAFRSIRPVIPGIGELGKMGKLQFSTSIRDSLIPAIAQAKTTARSIVNNFIANVHGGRVDVDEDRLVEMFARMEILYG